MPEPIQRGWWNLTCFNALSKDQQEHLVEQGYLPWGWLPVGINCRGPAEVEVTTIWDKFPGPRFYCRGCAIKYLESELPDQPTMYTYDCI